MRVLGIDYGSKKIGIAIGDTDSKISSPWVVLQNTSHGEIIKQIKLICEQEDVDRVVLGIPISLNIKKISPQQKEVELFMEDLRAINIPVDEEDERLTTASAKYYLQSSKQQDDAVSASIMLQTYLEKY